ncbi:hypothetical protein BJY04DRAFT_187148 [Aspergillus karnatakaensis]|uniref:uncharacterized protein n=1 Tax=Aspergillus karnatakaensis TaxID=1810916 RepID=UPI003CCE4883
MADRVTVVILDTSKYAPKFTMGYSIMSGISVLQFAMIFVLRYFANREKRLEVEEEERLAASGTESPSSPIGPATPVDGSKI